MLALAALACNANAQQPDTQATVAAIYLTITAQAEAAGIPTVTPGGTVPAESEPSVTPPAATETPTLTPTPPAERSGNGATLAFSRCSAGVVIDGDGSEWAGLSGVSAFALDTNTYGAANWSGVADASAQARACWAASTLYVLVDVTDDAHVQTQQGATAWRGDEVELVFDSDLRGDFYAESWNSDDTQLGLSPGDFGALPPSAVRYHPSVEGLSSIQVAARQAGSGYVLEAAIPWAVLGAAPVGSVRYGLCLALSDNDQPGQASQDSMVSHCTRLRVSDPTTWVTVEMAP
jgi:hypothetical protein